MDDLLQRVRRPRHTYDAEQLMYYYTVYAENEAYIIIFLLFHNIMFEYFNILICKVYYSLYHYRIFFFFKELFFLYLILYIYSYISLFVIYIITIFLLFGVNGTVILVLKI